MLCCSSECGSISIVQLRTIYCNTHVYTFYVCLCLLALTFVCNSTYLLKCSFQIYQKSIVVFIRGSKVWFKTTSCAKGPVARCNFPGNFQRNSTLKRVVPKPWTNIPKKVMDQALWYRTKQLQKKYVLWKERRCWQDKPRKLWCFMWWYLAAEEAFFTNWLCYCYYIDWYWGTECSLQRMQWLWKV